MGITTGKTISQFSLKSTLENSDTLMLQRGNQYFSVEAKSLTTGAFISDTYANVSTAKSGGTLKAGAIYYLTDKYIFLNAIDTNKFNLDGVFWARNADFNATGVYAGITIANGFTVNATGTNLDIWTSALAPASGDVAIWNNLHWLNITGANGASDPSADAVNWEAVANTNTDVANTYGYIYEYDAIEYDFDNDTINRRIDLRGNDIAVDSISIWQWGNNSVSGNVVVANGTFDIENQLGTVTDNYVISGVTLESSVSATTITGCYFATSSTAVAKVQIYDYTGYSMTNVSITGAPQKRQIYLIENITRESINYRDSSIEYDVELVATAYAGGTTYTFGDFATSGTVTYMYINETDTAGNAPPNATYWVEVFDKTTIGRYKLTISPYFNSAGTINLISTGATDIVDEIVYTSGFPNEQRLKFTCETGLATTFDNTVIASIANAGEIIASADVVVDGDQYEFAVFEKTTVAGTTVMRELYSQTAIA